MRLAKYLAHAGVASRRRSEELIASGAVTVGGKKVTDPARDVDEQSGVAVDGEPIKPEPREVWILHKPLNVVSTAREPGSRQAVTDLVPSRRRLYPVGRLDADSTGLILLTNDGELANRLTHPRYGVERTYRVALRKPPTAPQLARLRSGVKLEDGPAKAAHVKRVGKRGLEITVREGRNRQVRRMAEAIGHEVISLKRIRFGTLELERLPEGEAKKLHAAQVKALWKDSGLDE
ncbi:MAG: rRNA synthase [Solirubrobacterales bacterium]|jgi:23S rRNA pseudouridine2605 synthase|nr:rRNA synthase [Solirubrobacterales bacterium]